MTSFCGFCGAKAIDQRASFCSDCGGKLEQSVEEAPSAKSTLPFPSMTPVEAGVVLSKSFVDLIRQEAAPKVEDSASVELSKSFLSSISEIAAADPLLSRDTLREVPALASQIPAKEPLVTLPDFLAPMQNLPALAPLALPTEINPHAPALKFHKIATPAVAAPAIEIARDTVPESAPVQRAPLEEAPSVLLSTSLEQIILKEHTPKPEETKPEPTKPEAPTTAPKDEESPAAPAALPEVPLVAKVPFPRLEAPPKSILLAEPPSLLSEGFPERLAKAPPAQLFATTELQHAARSQWLQALLLLLAGPLLLRILQDLIWERFAALQPLFVSFMVCCLLFRLLAEERQPLWRSLAPLGGSFLFGLGASAIFGELQTQSASQLIIFSVVITLALNASLGLSWMLAPRLRIFSQPIDGLLLGVFSGAGFAAGAFPVSEAPNSALFAEMLCGGFAGYFLGLAAYKADARFAFVIAATLGVFLLQSALLLLSAGAFRAGGMVLGLLFTMVLVFGYLVLFGYAIKLKRLERN